jgi:2-octaprenyl-6-methoxyphenol hydroxylase
MACYATVKTSGVHGDISLTARLVVLAEGGALADSLPGIKRLVHDYQQCAVLAEVSTEQPPAGVAYERFSKQGPFALLPHGDNYMLVWTRSHDDAKALQQAPDEQVMAELQQAFGERQGKVLAIGPRASFPLALRQVNRVSSGRVVLIGNAPRPCIRWRRRA